MYLGIKENLSKNSKCEVMRIWPKGKEDGAHGWDSEYISDELKLLMK